MFSKNIFFIIRKSISKIRLFLSVIILSVFFLSGCGNFFDLGEDDVANSFDAGSSDGADALSASTNFSGKEGDAAPKIDPFAGAVYIPLPGIGNYGSVNLSYPIAIPAGRGGFVPNVSLSYSSSGGDGICGIGWSLSSGLPVISRTTSNGELYYDSRDTFVYNGKRLIKVSGSSKSEDGVYRAEIESDFARLELSNSSSGGVWKVYDKSGTVTYLGETKDERIYRPDNENKTYSWNFSRSVDLNGNYVRAAYDRSRYETDNVIYLKSISYTGNYNSGLEACQYVKFTYKDRDDFYVSKAAGFPMKIDRLLDTVVIGWMDGGDDEKLWDYTLKYVTGEDSERPLIKTIVSSRNTTKPEFIYQKADHSISWQGVNNPFASDDEIDPLTTEFFEGDFNGDGLSDMVVFNPETGDWKAAECSRTGGYEFKKYGNKFKGYKGTEKIKWFKGNVSGDYNGDGRSDIAFYLPETKEFFVAEHDGKIFNFVKYGELSEYLPDIFACEWFPGDYDGNGLSDALLYNEPDGSWILMKNEGGKFSFVKCSVSFKHLYRNDYSADSSLNSDMTSDRSRYGADRGKVHFLSGDYNADGRTDIALYDSRNGRWYVGENYRDEVNGFRLSWKLYKEFTPRESVLFGFDRFSGDFNGDGYSDFMLFDREKGEWIIGETGNETINFKTFSKTPEFKDITRWFQGDFNGDGRTDIGFYSKTDNCVWVGEARRDGFNFRIYSDVSYGGPNAENVFANVPLPQNEIKPEKGYGATGNSVVKYEFDANYEYGGGEKVFAGNFEGSGIQLLIFKNSQKKLFVKRNGILSPLGFGTDLTGKDVSFPLGERAVKNGSNDSVLIMRKNQSVYEYEAFSPGMTEKIASINARDYSFDPKKSLYSFLCDGGGISMFFLEDDPSTGVPLVYQFKNGSVKALSIEGIDASLFYNLKNSGAMSVLLNGEIVIIDKRTNPDSVYLGRISGNDIVFKKISNMAGLVTGENFRTEIIPGDGYFIVPSSSNGNVRFTRADFDYSSGTGNIYSFSPNGCSYSGIHSEGVAFVQTDEGIRCIVTGRNTFSVKKPTDAFISEVNIDREDLNRELYKYSWIQGDYNGDGKTDLGIFSLKESSWYFAKTNGTVPDMLESVKNGIGGKYYFTYANSSSFDNKCDDGLYHLPMNYKVCVRADAEDGFGHRVATKYEYKKGYAFSAFINGKKETDYFGFTEFTVTDALGSRTTNKYNSIPYDDFRKNRALAGAIKESRFAGFDGKEYSRSVYNYTLHEIKAGGTSYLIEPTKVQKYMYGSLFETAESNIELVPGEYNMKSRTESVTDHYADGVHSENTVRKYQEFSNNEMTNEMRLSKEKNYYRSEGETTSSYYYDSKGNLTYTVTSYTGGGMTKPADIKTRFEYDVYGNKTKQINESGSPARVTEWEYDRILSQYVVCERSYGKKELSTKYKINYGIAFGAIEEKTDPNGNSVYMTFDDYGRIDRQYIDTDDGKELLSDYDYDADNFPLRGTARQYDGEGNEKLITVYVDGVGRTIQTVTGGDGKFIKSGSVSFDNLGRVTRRGQNLWASSGDAKSYSESGEINPEVTDYDAAGRVKKTRYPSAEDDGRVTFTEFSYENAWKTIAKSSTGKKKTTVTNSRGLVLYVEESGTGSNGESVDAKIGFAYDACGRRIKKADLNSGTMSVEVNSSLFSPGRKDESGNNIAQWKYDGFGRVTESSDPDMGYTKLEYNEFGEVEKKTDAERRTTVFEYDTLGRVTKKTTADGTVKYEYDEGDNGLGKLTSMSETSQTKNIEYDAVGRVKKETRRMASEKFETEYEYDLLGRTKKIKYPNDPRSGERVSAEYEYGPFGAESVRLKQGIRSKSVIDSIEYNENGQIERIVRGNRTETKYEYDGRHRLKKLYAYNTANGEELQNVSYTFDDDDNITRKADEIGYGNGKRTVVSEYKYDGLNRLVEGKGRYELGETGEHWNAYTEKYSYSDDGNLLSKSLYGKNGTLDERLEYEYANHAVTDIHSSKYGNKSAMRYSPCGNMTYNSNAAKKTEKRMYYNTDNRIVKVTDKENITIGEYDYDDTGFRVRKQSRYMKDGIEKSKETITPSMYFSYEKELEISTDKELDKTYAVSHIYLNGVRIAAAMPNGECRYFLTDQVDSVNVVLNDKGDAVTRTEYKPYGEIRSRML